VVVGSRHAGKPAHCRRVFCGGICLPWNSSVGHRTRVCRPFSQVFPEGAQLVGPPRKGTVANPLTKEDQCFERSILGQTGRRAVVLTCGAARGESEVNDCTGNCATGRIAECSGASRTRSGVPAAMGECLAGRSVDGIGEFLGDLKRNRGCEPGDNWAMAFSLVNFHTAGALQLFWAASH
jgi:hypothetical protein